MKIFVEDKQAEINGKVVNYKSFYVEIELPKPIGKYKVNLKFETKNEKENILNNLDVANLDIENKIVNDRVIITPKIYIGSITFVPKLTPDTLTLLRIALNK